jgi:translocation and assembly module TamA
VLADSRADIPSAYLFRTGGDNTIRGYAYESLGVAEGDSVVGGRYLGVASIEYVQWVREQWGAAVFYDFGNAVDDLSAWRTVSGYGAGVRWSSPIGALSLDLAYGRATEEWRVHFNAGIAFR